MLKETLHSAILKHSVPLGENLSPICAPVCVQPYGVLWGNPRKSSAMKTAMAALKRANLRYVYPGPIGVKVPCLPGNLRYSCADRTQYTLTPMHMFGNSHPTYTALLIVLEG